MPPTVPSPKEVPLIPCHVTVDVSAVGSKYGNVSAFVPPSRKVLKDKSRRDWSYIQKIMLQNLIRTSKGINGNNPYRDMSDGIL
jgi:hypothetical protein